MNLLMLTSQTISQDQRPSCFDEVVFPHSRLNRLKSEAMIVVGMNLIMNDKKSETKQNYFKS
jgi:uncharacterized protein YeaC (DUF1315 family)